MGYIISYGCGTGMKAPIKKKVRRLLPALSGITCVGLLLFVFLFPAVRTALRDFLLPGDGAVTAQALQNLASDLKAGEDWSVAVSAFCHEILTEAAG